MDTENPLDIRNYGDAEELQLVETVLAGNRVALEKLILRHQAWIYNIAFRMVLNHADAEDVSQEIIVKIMTKLSTFAASKGSFRTWLYRIVANHVIDMKRREYERPHLSLERYYSFVDEICDEAPAQTPEVEMVIQDTMVGCVLGTLLCLDRRQRLVFVLGVVFDVSSEQGSEILGISRAAFRKTLSRARARLYKFMMRKCGVVNRDAPCKCKNKVSEFMRRGVHTPDNLMYYREDAMTVHDVIARKINRFSGSIYSDFLRLYRSHPFYEAPDMVNWMRKMLESREFKETFQLD